jgi:hypothetical protein
MNIIYFDNNQGFKGPQRALEASVGFRRLQRALKL